MELGHLCRNKSSTPVLVANARYKAAGIFPTSLFPDPMSVEPIQIFLADRSGRQRHRIQLNNRMTVARDDDVLALESEIDQFRQPIFGFCDAMR